MLNKLDKECVFATSDQLLEQASLAGDNQLVSVITGALLGVSFLTSIALEKTAGPERDALYAIIKSHLQATQTEIDKRTQRERAELCAKYDAIANPMPTSQWYH